MAQEEWDSSSEEDECSQWALGFLLEPTPPLSVLRHRFPSKVGGRPAWLDPCRLPTPEQLGCTDAAKPPTFLLQVYAPYQDVFHRTLFLFCHTQGPDLTRLGAVRALRGQLPQENPFYSSEPPRDPFPQGLPLTAEQREQVYARDPWGTLAAEDELRSGQKPPEAARSRVHLLPELKIEVEHEGSLGSGASSSRGASASPPLGAAVPLGALQPTEGEDLDSCEAGELARLVEGQVHPDVRAFAAFSARVSRAPMQVLRYCFRADARPLWPKAGGVPSPSDIPPCRACGAPRHFELQVLPQLLNWIGAEDEDHPFPDFSTLAVYSCSRSCEPPPGGTSSAYLEEFVWVQGP